jgi:hypothetical protein
MSPTDAQLLPRGFSTTKKEGAFAQFDAQGRLLHYGWYKDGQPLPGTFAITADPETGAVRVDSFPKPEIFAVEDGRTFEDGQETFENDPQVTYPPADAQRQAFIQQWAKKADGKPPPYDPGCAFCGKKRAEVRRLIMGPSAGICEACIQICNEIAAE